MIASDFVVRDDEHGYDYAYTGIDPTSDDAEESFGALIRDDDLAPSDVVCGYVVCHAHDTGLIDLLYCGELMYVPEAGRAAMRSRSNEWDWTDASDLQDALERFVHFEGQEPT